MPTQWIPFSQVLDEDLKDPAEKEEWDNFELARVLAIEILRYRADHSLKQREMAGKLEMKQSQLSRLEGGEVNPTIETLRRICKALGMTVTVRIDSGGEVEAKFGSQQPQPV